MSVFLGTVGVLFTLMCLTIMALLTVSLPFPWSSLLNVIIAAYLAYVIRGIAEDIYKFSNKFQSANGSLDKQDAAEKGSS